MDFQEFVEEEDFQEEEEEEEMDGIHNCELEEGILSYEEERNYTHLEELLLSHGLHPDFGNICEDQNKSIKIKLSSFKSKDEEIAEIYRNVISHETRRGKNCNCLTKHANSTNVSLLQTQQSIISLVDLIMYTRNYIRSMRESPDDVLRCTLKGKIQLFE